MNQQIARKSHPVGSRLQTPDVFVTSRGYEIKIRPVSSTLIADVNALIPDPLKPTYKVQTIGGGEEDFEHTPSTLQSDADKQAWADYSAKLAQAHAARLQKLTEVILTEGIDIPEPDPAWVERMRRFGLTIPDDPWEFRKFYLERGLLGATSEVFDLVLAVMERSQDVPEEAIQAIRDAFKSGLEEYKARITAVAKQSLDVLPFARSHADGQGVGDQAE